MDMAKTIALLGGLETKGAAYGFVQRRTEKRRRRTLVIDVGVLDLKKLRKDLTHA